MDAAAYGTFPEGGGNSRGDSVMDGLPSGYDAWRTSGPPEPSPSDIVGHCVYCGDPLYTGEKIIETVDGDWLHGEDGTDCFDEYVENEYVARRFVASY